MQQDIQSQRNYAGSEMEESLTRAIHSGELAAGAVLDSTGVLAKRYGVSIKTAQKVLQKLSREGYLIRRNGAPTEVAARPEGTIGIFMPHMGGRYTFEDSKVHYLTVGGILSGCNQNNMNMMVIQTGRKHFNMQELNRMNLSGILFVYPLEEDVELLAMLKNTGLPMVCINLLDSKLQNEYAHINFDYVAAGRRAWLHFRKCGTSRPAFYSRLPLNSFEHRQYLYEGLCAAASEDGVRVKLVSSSNGNDEKRDFSIMTAQREAIEAELSDADAVLFGETWEAEAYRSWGHYDKCLCGFFTASSHIPYFTLDYEQIGINALSMLIGRDSYTGPTKCMPDARNMDN